MEIENLQKVKTALRFKTRGMSISELARHLKMNRNSVAKYLEILQISGEVEANSHGTSKVYTLSDRVPVSAMLHFSSDMIVMIDHGGRIIQCNDPFIQFIAIPREQLIGQVYTDLSYPFIRELPVDRLLLDSSKQDEGIFEKSFERDGSTCYLEIRMISTVFDKGNSGVTLIIADISDRKRAEHALEDREQQYRTVIENIQDVFYRSDVNGNLIMASPSWASLLGYGSLEECIGKNIAEKFYYEPNLRREFLEAVKTNGSVHDYEVILKKKDGSPLYVSTNSHRYFNKEGILLGVEGIFRDMTERHESNVKIQRYISHIEYLSQKLIEFIELPSDADIYKKIAGDIRALVPDSLVSVSSYDASTGLVTIRAVQDPIERDICAKILGQNPIGLSLPMTPFAFNSLTDGVLHRANISLYDACFQAIPKEVCNEVEHALDMGENYTIGFTFGGELFGSLMIFLCKGATIPDISLVEEYIRQASIALQKRIAEDARKKSEEIFITIAEQSPFPLAIIDKNSTIRFINPRFTQTFGYDLKDFRTGREWFILAFPDTQYRENAISLWKADVVSFPDQGTVPHEFVIRCKDGTDKVILFRMMYLSTKEKCVICEDLTERREAEKTRQLLSSIVTSTEDAIIGKDTEGTIISWNMAAERMFGYTEKEIIGRSISTIVPVRLLPELQTILASIRNGESVSNFETQRIRKNGTLIEVAVTISPIVDVNGSVIGASTISRDITSKKAEERLKESEEQYRSFVENVNVGVYRSTGDVRGRFVWGNSSLVGILGYSSFDHLSEIDIAEIFIDLDERRKYLSELQKSGFVKNRELQLKRADGSTIWVLVTALAQIDPGGKITYINGIVEDITRQKMMMNEVTTLHCELDKIADFCPDAICVVDMNNTIIVWNTAMQQLTGVHRDQIIGKTENDHGFPFYDTPHSLLLDLIDKPDEEIRNRYPDMKRDGANLYAEAFIPHLNAGKGAYLWVKAAPLMDDHQKRLGAIEVIRDISDKKNIEAYLRLRMPGTPGDKDHPSLPGTGATFESKGMTEISDLSSIIRLQQALKKTPDYIAILDLSGICLWANTALVTVIGGREASSINGTNITRYIAPEFRKIILDGISDTKKNGHKVMALMLFTRSGRVPVDVVLSVINDDAGTLMGYLAIARDTSPHMQKGKSAPKKRESKV